MGNFANVFKKLRLSMGLTQEELASKLNISRSRIGMYETGSREPDFETLELIADFFNVDMDYLLGRSDKTSILPETIGSYLKSVSGYYTNPETAKEAQEMFEDPEMRSLFHMKRNMDPDQFKIHMDYIKKLYKAEHPDYDEGC